MKLAENLQNMKATDAVAAKKSAKELQTYLSKADPVTRQVLFQDMQSKSADCRYSDGDRLRQRRRNRGRHHQGEERHARFPRRIVGRPDSIGNSPAGPGRGPRHRAASEFDGLETQRPIQQDKSQRPGVHQSGDEAGPQGDHRDDRRSGSRSHQDYRDVGFEKAASHRRANGKAQSARPRSGRWRHENAGAARRRQNLRDDLRRGDGQIQNAHRRRRRKASDDLGRRAHDAAACHARLDGRLGRSLADGRATQGDHVADETAAKHVEQRRPGRSERSRT